MRLNLSTIYVSKGVAIRHTLLSVLILLGFTACQDYNPPAAPTTTCGPESSTSQASSFGLVQSTPNWEDDVFPLLQSNGEGSEYKCTVCHAGYSDYELVKDPSEFQKIMSAISRQSMPLNGDYMTNDDQALLRAWESAGYPENSSDQGGSDSNPGTDSGGDDGQNRDQPDGSSSGDSSPPPTDDDRGGGEDRDENREIFGNEDVTDDWSSGNRSRRSSDRDDSGC